MATDKLFYEYAKQFPQAIAKFIDAGPDHFEVQSLVLKETERRADLLLVNASHDRVILVETQGYWDDELYHRMVATMMLYCLQHRYRGKMEAAVIFLEEAHARAAEKFHEQFRGMISSLVLTPRILVLRRLKPAELARWKDVHLMPLYPLCDISEEEIAQYAPEWAAQIRTSPMLVEEERLPLLAILGLAISHRIRTLTKNEIIKLLGGVEMIDAPVIQEIIQEATQKARLQGKQEGRQEGRQEEAQHLIHSLIATKFGKVPEDIHLQVEAVFDPEVLNRIALALLTIQNVEELRNFLLSNRSGNGKNAS